MHIDATLRDMRGFYHRLDHSLEKHLEWSERCGQPLVAVGGDAAHMVMRYRMGGEAAYMSEMESCQKDFDSLKIPKDKKPRFVNGAPMFGDADLYMRSPANTLQLNFALQDMGYQASHTMKHIDDFGHNVYINKEFLPQKVEVFVDKNNDHHHRPGNKPIYSLLPVVDGCNTTELPGYKNLRFIEPASFVQRLTIDKSKAEGDIPSKMLQDMAVVWKHLGRSSEMLA